MTVRRPAKAMVVALGLLVLALLALSLLAVRPAYAVGFSVDRSDDPDLASTPTADDCRTSVPNDCSLRGAIKKANAVFTTDTISFAIPDGPAPGLEVKTISPVSSLPAITDRVTIDGYSQEGAQPNTATTNANSAVLKIELNGSGAGGFAQGLFVTGGEAAGTVIRGLVINRFRGDGVFADADGTILEGNFIGTDPSGTIDRGNGSEGVRVTSSGSRVGGAANEAQNVISGNAGNGVSVLGSTSTGNVVSNNHIGTDADAEEDLGNSKNGVLVERAPGVLVGGEHAGGASGAGGDVGTVKGEGNIISGNDAHGVLVDDLPAEGTRITGNLIGLNRNGNGTLGNTLDGVRVQNTPRVEVGGTQAGQGNTIADNGESGVQITGADATNNRVLGNHIGTNFNGSSAFGNAGDGVLVANASGTAVGGIGARARNVISGNAGNGVRILGPDATVNQVSGNIIGLDRGGSADLGNRSRGVAVEDAPDNLIGGTLSGEGNVVSGNDGSGVSIRGAGSSANRVQGNLVGTDRNGSAALGNRFSGVSIDDGVNNTIGGTESGAGNVISGNDGDGVDLDDPGTAGNRIEGNLIGTRSDGTGDLGNGDDGVVLDGPGNFVGGSTDEARNVISGNDGDGVVVFGAAATANRILRNSIFANGGLGIDLIGGTENAQGATQNDPRDPDAGPNTLQNKPNLTSAVFSDGGLTVQGSLNSTPNRTFTIQFFANPQGENEGKSFLGQRSVTTNANGNASFAFVVAAAPIGTRNVTATATRAGNTSEFSGPRAVTTS